MSDDNDSDDPKNNNKNKTILSNPNHQDTNINAQCAAADISSPVKSSSSSSSLDPGQHSEKPSNSNPPAVCSGPLTLTCLGTQIGGHHGSSKKYSNKKLGLFDLRNGRVLKCLLPPPRGPRELAFYQSVYSPDCIDKDLLALREFIPQFYGTEKHDDDIMVKLNNLTWQFKKPCIMDLKMGRITYDEEATDEKIREEEKKFPPLKKIGFQITGMLIQNDDEVKKIDKHFTRTLTEYNIVKNGLGIFFSVLSEEDKLQVLHGLIYRLGQLEAWFQRQKKYSFTASSLLFVYEGSGGKRLPNHLVSTNNNDDNDNVSVDNEILPDAENLLSSINVITSNDCSGSNVKVKTTNVDNKNKNQREIILPSNKSRLTSSTSTSSCSTTTTSSLHNDNQYAPNAAQSNLSHLDLESNTNISRKRLQNNDNKDDSKDQDKADVVSGSEEFKLSSPQEKVFKIDPTTTCDVSVSDRSVVKADRSDDINSLSSPNSNSNITRTSSVANDDELMRHHSNSNKSKLHWSVHLIDFAHVFPASNVDKNFLYGLQNLKASLKSLL